MSEYRAHDIFNVVLPSPIRDCVPVSTLVLRVEARPRPTVILNPLVCLDGHIAMTHENLSEHIDTVISVF